MAQRTLEQPLGLDYANGQVLTMSGSSQQSAAFSGVSAVRIATEGQPAWFAVGTNPTAVNSGASALLGANSERIVKLSPGDKIAVLQAGSAGVFSMVPVL